MTRLRVRTIHHVGWTEYEVVRRSWENGELVVLRAFITAKSANEWIAEVEERHELLLAEDCG